jgi:hypothetical protein
MKRLFANVVRLDRDDHSRPTPWVYDLHAPRHDLVHLGVARELRRSQLDRRVRAEVVCNRPAVLVLVRVQPRQAMDPA